MKRSMVRNAVVAALGASVSLGLVAEGSVEQQAPSTGNIERVSIVGAGVEQLNLLGSTSILTSEQLEAFEFDDISQVLSRIPGVNIRQEDGYGLRPNIGFRGVTPIAVKKLIFWKMVF